MAKRFRWGRPQAACTSARRWTRTIREEKGEGVVAQEVPEDDGVADPCGVPSISVIDPAAPVNPTVQYAYGFMDRVVGGRRWVGHGGGAAGMNGDLAFEPNGGYVVVVLANLDPPAAGQMAAFILNRLPTSTP